MHIHTYTDTQIHIYTHTHIHTYTYTYTHTHVDVYAHTRIHAYSFQKTFLDLTNTTMIRPDNHTQTLVNDHISAFVARFCLLFVCAAECLGHPESLVDPAVAGGGYRRLQEAKESWKGHMSRTPRNSVIIIVLTCDVHNFLMQVYLLLLIV